jgi:radical SAM enzyme (TIGR01210 family)
MYNEPDVCGQGAPTLRGVRNRLDPQRPVACFIEGERGENGVIEPGATVLLTNRGCPWRCIYCDLWKNTLAEPTPPGAIPAQIDWALEQLGIQAGETAHPALNRIKLYNAGSFFDRAAIPKADHAAIADRASRFKRVVVECHPALVGESALRFRDRIAPAQFEMAMGLETANPGVLEKLNKRMTLDLFQRASAFLKTHGIALRVFTLLQPPFLPDPDEALHWSHRSLDFAFDCGATAAVVIPTRGGNVAMEELTRAGQFAPPNLSALEAATNYGCGLKRGRVFADLWDWERFPACPHCRTARVERLRQMNFSQIPPSPIQCGHCAESQCGRINSALQADRG